jgi:MFS family permease
VWVLVSRFVINTGVYTILPFLLYYLMNGYGLAKNDALKQLVVIALLVNIMGLLATFPAGLASDRTSKKNVIYATCALCVIGGLGFVFSQSITFALVAAGIFGLGYGAFSAVDWALVCNVLPEGEPAKYMGLWSCADTVPQIVAPFLGSAVATWTISNYNASIGYRAVMFTAIVWFVLGTFFIRFVKERVTQNAEIEPNVIPKVA